MNLRRFLLEAATLVAAAVVVALVSNALAGRERKLKLVGDYPGALRVPASSSAPPPGAVPASSLASTSPAAPSGISSKGLTGGPAGEAHEHSPLEEKRPSPDAPPSPESSGASEGTGAGESPVLRRFPPHPNEPWTEISGADAAALLAAKVPFLDARRTEVFREGHVAGARPFSVWESDIDRKVVDLVGEGRDTAAPIVVYCSGGDCEDSHLLAQKLWGAGFGNVLVYKDGFPDWVRRGGAIRTGETP